MIDVIRRMLAPLQTRIANMIARAVVSRVDDSKKMQIVQISMGDETHDDIERVQNYGFTSVPQEGAEAAVIFVGGGRDHGLAIAVDDRRYRVKGLQAGEVAVYTDQGDKIVIKRGGNIEVTASTKVVINAPLAELTGNTQAAVLGTTYRTAETTSNTSVTAALTANAAAMTAVAAAMTAIAAAIGSTATITALGPAAATASTAAATAAAAGATAFTAGATALTTFEGGAASYLSAKVKLS